MHKGMDYKREMFETGHREELTDDELVVCNQRRQKKATAV
jgi:hypothetical protein